jgi:hypothetical protein
MSGAGAEPLDGIEEIFNLFSADSESMIAASFEDG